MAVVFSIFLRRQMNCSTFLVCFRLPAPSLRPHKDANGTTTHTAKKSPFNVFLRPTSPTFLFIQILSPKEQLLFKKQQIQTNDSQLSSESIHSNIYKYTATNFF
uniref:Secreted protein n=1 Tax=Panagrolaimus sp. ES5 TaxID=591445 RepID=A0AC34FDM5_9BILA